MHSPTTGQKIRALLATGRVANLPTVWTNVLVGFWIASHICGFYQVDDYLITARYFLLILTCLIASAIYVGGCLLGDAVDIEFDQKNRPNRPLPQGVLSVGRVKFSAYCLFALALLGISSSTFIAFIGSLYIHDTISLSELLKIFSSQSALEVIQLHELILGSALIICVMTYAYCHKSMGKAAIFLMATCRFMLVLFGISVAHKSFFAYAPGTSDHLILHVEWSRSWMVLLAAAVGLYTLLLSWVASTESDNKIFQKRTLLSALLLAIPALTFAFQVLIFRVSPEGYSEIGRPLVSFEIYASAWNLFYAVLLGVYAWLFFALLALRKSKPTFVSRALAGFCLLDAAFIAPFFPSAAMICIGFFALALLLQRFAPAT